MISSALGIAKVRFGQLMAQSGSFVTSGHGMAPAEEGLIEIALGAALGGFCGLLGGFVLSRVLRFVSLLTGRSFGGYRWVIYGALVGAAVFGCAVATDGTE